MFLDPDVEIRLNLFESTPGALLTGSGTISHVRYQSQFSLVNHFPGKERFVNSGIVYPNGNGSSRIVFNVFERLESTADAVYQFCLYEPANPETSSIAVHGEFEKNGTLLVEFGEGYHPNGGESYRLMTYDSRVGDFVETELPALPDDLRGWVDSTSTSMVYNVQGAGLNLAMNTLPEEMEVGRLYPLFITVSNPDSVMARDVELALDITGGLTRNNPHVNLHLGNLAPGESAHRIIVIRADRFGQAGFTAEVHHRRKNTLTSDWWKSTSTMITGKGMGRSDLLVIH